jgi:hypothetical protein
MVFNNNETLASLYEGITKRIDPSSEQSTRQAPTLSNTDLSKDQDLLAEAYKAVGKKETCMHAAKGCDCDGCKECKANQKPVEEAKKAGKPDYMDLDGDGDKKESMKKAVKDKKPTKGSFKDNFNKVMSKKKSA